MTIVFAASEMVPFCKTGGLADVIGALPPVLSELGHNVSVMLPGFKSIDRMKYGFEVIMRDIPVRVGENEELLTLSSAIWKGITVYLLDNEKFFGREGLYGDLNGDYDDNDTRFVFFSRGILEACIKLDIYPDMVHAHDWQTGLVMTYLATIYSEDNHFKNTGTLFTIHNLGYQGIFPTKVIKTAGLPESELDWTKMEFWGKVSFLKAGIVYSGAVSTVSETYSREITTPELGFGMDGVLGMRKQDLYGILNGIDENEWNPETDSTIAATYSIQDMSGKKKCRDALLSTCGMQAPSDIPVFGMVTRLDDQKGLDILEESIGRMESLDIRLAILGTGTHEHHEKMRVLAERYPGNVCLMLRFDNAMARMIYAGADAFLMPSRYEPCGLGQLIAMRYGTLPVVHRTGGLADTVIDLDERPGDGTGFSFHEYSAEGLMDAVGRAVKAYRANGRVRWKNAVKRAMQKDYSWKSSAKRYIDLFHMIKNRKPVGSAVESVV